MPVISRFWVARLSELFSRLPTATLASVVIHALVLVILHQLSGDLFRGTGNPASGQTLAVFLHEVSDVKGASEDKVVSDEVVAEYGRRGDVSEVERPKTRAAEVVGASERETVSIGSEAAGRSNEPVRFFYPADQLSVRPIPLSEIESPDFDMPMQDRRASVVIDVSISEVGEVVSVQQVMSGLPETYTESLVAAFRRLRFRPGEINGLRVGALLRVELTAENLGLPIQ